MSNEYRDWMADQIQDLKLDLIKCLNIIENEYSEDSIQGCFVREVLQKYNLKL